MPNLYQNPAFDAKNRMNESQLQNHFDAFYEDIWCELCKYGELEELVVCDNNNDRQCDLLQPHGYFFFTHYFFYQNKVFFSKSLL